MLVLLLQTQEALHNKLLRGHTINTTPYNRNTYKENEDRECTHLIRINRQVYSHQVYSHERNIVLTLHH
jgi:hypothetical protein